MTKPLPHDGVFVRLGISKIHGIGVFAEQPIRAGTDVFANDDREISWVSSSVLQDPSAGRFQRLLYEDFAIRRGNELGCPANFNLLTVGWYVNEPAPGHQPNLTATANFSLIALRDIAAGEELTIRYADFGGHS
jgi:hypothetical protein